MLVFCNESSHFFLVLQYSDHEIIFHIIRLCSLDSFVCLKLDFLIVFRQCSVQSLSVLVCMLSSKSDTGNHK